MRSETVIIAVVMITLSIGLVAEDLEGGFGVIGANVPVQNQAYTVSFEREIRFRSLNEDLSKTCHASGDVRGCTEFPVELLECDCELDDQGWRLRITARIEALIHVDHTKILMHEQQHLLHLDALLKSYLARMTAPVFPTERRCRAIGRILSRPEYVTSMMNDLRTASNERFQCDRPGSNHPEGLLALERRSRPLASTVAR